MIGTLLGVALRQRRAGLTGLALIAVASGFATVLILLAAATWQGSGRQQARMDKLVRPYPIPWIDDGNGARHSNAVRSVEIVGGPNTGYQASTTRLAGRDLLTIRLAVGGPGAPVPPGISRLPKPGEAFLSSGLATLASGDASTLSPGVKAIGTVSSSVLRAPDQLVQMLGVTPPVGVMNTMDWAVLTSFSPPRGNPSDGRSFDSGQLAGGRFTTIVTAAGLLIALLAFVASAGQFALASRERRFAAMALAGATPRQVHLVAAFESGAAALVGSIAGIGVTAMLLWLRGDEVAFLGYSAFRRDLVLPWWVLACTLLGVALLSATAAAAGARRPARGPTEMRHGARPRRFLDRLGWSGGHAGFLRRVRPRSRRAPAATGCGRNIRATPRSAGRRTP